MHEFQIQNPQSSILLGLAHCLPIDKAVPAFGRISSFPKERSSDLINGSENPWP
jgi:hypothetical protein